MDPKITGVNPTEIVTYVEDLPIIIDYEVSNKYNEIKEEDYDIIKVGESNCLYSNDNASNSGRD